MKPSGKWAILFKFLRFYRPYRRRLWEGLILMGLSAALTLPLPLLTLYIFDEVIPDRNTGMLDLLAILLLGIILFQMLTQLLQTYVMEVFRLRMMNDVQAGILRRVHALPLHRVRSMGTGYLMSRIAQDVVAAQGAVSGGILSTARNGLSFIFGFALVYALNWRLALLTTALLPFFYLSVVVFFDRLRNLQREIQERQAQSNRILEESLAASLIVKAYNRGRGETRRYIRALSDLLRLVLRTQILGSVSGAISTFVTLGCPLLILWYGGRQIIQGTLTLGAFIAFNQLVAYLFRPAQTLITTNLNLHRSMGAMERILELLEAPLEPDTGRLPFPAKGLNIGFEGLRFAYPGGPDVLHGIDLEIREGESVAIVGPSGAGKTTMVSLLLRFYEPTEGRVHLAGNPLAEYPLAELRERITLVPQEAFLFSATVEENLRFARPGATPAEIERAAEAAGIHDYIRGLSQGYDTVLGAGGIACSAGEKQRLALARALLRDTPILILDEATSAVDVETEARIFHAMRELLKNRTAILIAHRLSTVSHADRIVVLQEGRIVGSGRHEELLGTNAFYAHLFREYEKYYLGRFAPGE